MRGRLFEPGRFRAVAPSGQFLGQRHVAHELPPGLEVGLLNRQRLVINEPTRTCETAHVALLFAVRHAFEYEGLKMLHDAVYSKGLIQKSKPDTLSALLTPP